MRVQVRLVVQVGRQEVTALWPEFFFAAQVHVVVVLERLLVVLVLERLPVVLEPLVLWYPVVACDQLVHHHSVVAVSAR